METINKIIKHTLKKRLEDGGMKWPMTLVKVCPKYGKRSTRWFKEMNHEPSFHGLVAVGVVAKHVRSADVYKEEIPYLLKGTC